MSSEQTKTPKESRAKKWLRRLRGGSPSPAVQASAPSTPQSLASTGSVPLVSSTASLATQPTESEATSKSDGSTGNNETPGPSGLDVAKDYLSVTGSFLQLVLKKLPDAVDSNPGMDDNANNVKKRIFATSELLLTVETALGGWEGSGSADETAAMETFKREVGTELSNLLRIRDQGRARRLALQEEDEQQIVDIFDRVDEARNRLMVATTHRIHRIVAEHQREFDLFLRQHLKISVKADHRFRLGKEEDRRTECIPGTRVDVCEAIIQWATNTSPDRASVYWLSGQGGAGKTTIAFTIARRFESTVTTASGSAVLGGSFFCSHTEPETSSSEAIVRTIVYRLASRSKAFKVALKECFNIDTVDHDPRTQLEGLLVEPWKKSALGRLAEDEPCYVIPIDALDELEGKGGTEFLEALFDVVNEHDLTGLKFFITSRSEPALVERIHAFTNKQVCRLEEVPVEETNADIGVYLREKLGKCATDTDIQQLVEDSAGLFIYASTVVKYVDGFSSEVQSRSLKQLVALRHSTTHQLPLKATARLDKLYLQILETSLVGPGDRDDPIEATQCLSILHTFLCTFERTSASAVSDLLEAVDGDDPKVMDAYAVLRRLHAVLTVEDGRVSWFHKSFPDFVFDKKRSLSFHCNQEQHHQLLAKGCFGIMNNQLRFNIADISSSFKLDRDHPTLSHSIESNISPALAYACQYWAGHLTRTPAQHPETLCVALSDFLQLRVLFWLEAMNLLQKRGCCDGMLRTLKKWVMQSKDLPQLADDVAAAAAFALYFTGSRAALSTPHLYISSLATFPRNYDLTRTWKQHFPGIPKFTPASEPAAGALLFCSKIRGEVRALAISPDGTHIASGSDHGFVQVWNLSTGEELEGFERHDGERWVASVAFSPDSRCLASASPGEPSIRIWDLQLGGKLKILNGHTRGVFSVAWSPDGSFIASGSSDKTVRLWDVSTGETLQVLEGHTEKVSVVVYSPDRIHVASRSPDRTVRIWNVATGQEIKSFACPKVWDAHNSSMAYSPDGSHIARGSDDGVISVWNVSTGDMQAHQVHTSTVQSLCFSSTGEHLISGAHNKAIRIWCLATGEVTTSLQPSRDWPLATSSAYLPDSMRFASGESDGTIHVWDLSTGERLDKEKTGVTAAAVSYSPDGKRILAPIPDSKAVCIWDALTGEVMCAMEGQTNAAAWSPDGTHVAYGSFDATIRISDSCTGIEMVLMESRADVERYTLEPIPGTAGRWPTEVRIKEYFTVKDRPDEVASFGYSPDGARIISSSYNGNVHVWDSLTGKELKRFKFSNSSTSALACSPDGTRVITNSPSKPPCVWDLSSGEKLMVLTTHGGGATAMAHAPDGRTICGSGDCSLLTWDAATGEQLWAIEGFQRDVLAVAYSPDGSCIISSNRGDSSIHMWDASTGKDLGRLIGHTGDITSLAFSPDGMPIISASADGSIRQWLPLSEHSRMAYIREKANEAEYTGWLCSPSDPSAYLMFVRLSEKLPEGYNILTFPSINAARVDLSHAKLGERWAQCYVPVDLS